MQSFEEGGFIMKVKPASGTAGDEDTKQSSLSEGCSRKGKLIAAIVLEHCCLKGNPARKSSLLTRRCSSCLIRVSLSAAPSFA